MDIRNNVIRIFEENGIDCFDSKSIEEIDSVQYMTIIVEIEQSMGITLPDDLLERNEFTDIDKFINDIKTLYDDAL